MDARTYGAGDSLEWDPRLDWSTLLLAQGGSGFEVFSESGPVEVQWLGAGEQRLAVLTKDAHADSIQVGLAVGGVDCKRFPGPDWEFGPAREGETAAPGMGALVRTAGFLANGTLFYTNMPEIDGGAGGEWPRVDWYAWGGEGLLPVYVYGQERSEQPAQWKGSADHLEGAGAPVEAQGVGATLDAVAGVGYFTTIEGFNEGLKGLSTSTLRVVVMPPEQGYTRPGNEDHPLYGEPLVFLMQLVAVTDQPCPWGGPVAMVPVLDLGCFRS